MASHPIYQFYAELNGYEPKIWRRFQVMNNITVARLGYILLTLFEMQASHLFSFELPYRKNLRHHLESRHSSLSEDFLAKTPETHFYWLDTDAEDFYDNDESFEANESKIKHLVYEPQDELVFNYDFGDSWQVNILLEEVIEESDIHGKELPRVLAGEGYGIIEDCGGVGGLAELAEAYKQQQGEEYEEYRNWLGIDTLDLTSFDVDDMNFRLKKVPRIYSDIYEKELLPTKQSMDILERRYLKTAGKTSNTMSLAKDETGLIKDLALVLLYLTSWTENEESAFESRRSWRSYDWDALDALEDQGLISYSRKAKSVYLTDEGVTAAKGLLEEIISVANNNGRGAL